jgi:2-polyprenyl-3-methyl-5-hydroxy-6-metoxy-1,4-benzoquinol methylase
MATALTRPCPLCGVQNAAAFMRKNELRLVRCADCGMTYADPVPAEFASGVFYNDAGGEYLSADKLTGDYADVRFARELRHFRRLCPRGSVLDVGCSSGGFLYQLTRQFPDDYQALGTDVSRAPLEHAKKMGVPVIEDNFLAHPFPEKFDAITFWAVMEHLFEPQKFFQKAVSLLKPGGLCFILVPNMKSLAVRLLGPKYRYIFPEHINYFTPRTLKAFAARELEVLELKSTHFNPLVVWKDFRGGARDIPRSERAELLKQTTAYKQSRWLFPARLAYRGAENVLGALKLADNLLVIGRKRN